MQNTIANNERYMHNAVKLKSIVHIIILYYYYATWKSIQRAQKPEVVISFLVDLVAIDKNEKSVYSMQKGKPKLSRKA